MKKLLALLITMLLVTRTLFGQGPILEQLKRLNDECNNGNRAACQELINIARTHDSSRVRQVAVQYLTNQLVLMEIAEKDRSFNVCVAAFKKITEDSILIRFVTRDSRFPVEAIRKIKSQAYLTNIARSDFYRRNIAIERLTDPEVLGEIARTDKDQSARRTALMNPHLTDAATLIAIAQTDADASIRQAAAVNPNLTDRTALANIAKNDSDPYVRAAVFLKPYAADHWLLAKMCRSGQGWQNWHDRSEAAGTFTSRINSQDTLAFLAKHAPEQTEVSLKALDRLVDQTLIADVYDHAESNSVRWSAIGGIKDEKKLLSIVRTAKDTTVRINTVRRLADHSMLLSLLKDRQVPVEVRMAVAKHMIRIQKMKQTKEDNQIIEASLIDIGLSALTHGKSPLYRDVYSTLSELNPAKSTQMRRMGPKGAIKGSLQSQENKTPLANVSVILAQVVNDDECMLFSDLIVPTDAGGRFVLKDVPIGKYTVACSERIQTNTLPPTLVRKMSPSIAAQRGKFESGQLVRGTRSLYYKDIDARVTFIIQAGSLLQFDIRKDEFSVQDIEVYGPIN